MRPIKALITFHDGLILPSSCDATARTISPVVAMRGNLGCPGQHEVAKVHAASVRDWWCVVDRGTGLVVWGQVAGDHHHECVQAMEKVIYEPEASVLEWVGADSIRAAAVLRIAIGDAWPGKAAVLKHHFPLPCVKDRWLQLMRIWASTLR